MGLFHIVTRREWEALPSGARYEPDSLRREGFIHLSSDTQLLPSAARHFSTETDLLVLSLHTERVIDRVRYELAEYSASQVAGRCTQGERYPHLYGSIEPEDIAEVVALPRDPDGTFRAPVAWRPWPHDDC